LRKLTFSDDLEDAGSRLKASRLRVAELEKQLAQSNTKALKAETVSGNNSKQMEKLQNELFTKRYYYFYYY